jgi:hypothetical protein
MDRGDRPQWLKRPDDADESCSATRSQSPYSEEVLGEAQGGRDEGGSRPDTGSGTCWLGGAEDGTAVIKEQQDRKKDRPTHGYEAPGTRQGRDHPTRLRQALEVVLGANVLGET